MESINRSALNALFTADREDPQWAEWAAGQFIFMNDLEVVESDTYGGELEYIRPQSKPRKRTDPDYRKPTLGQKRMVKDILVQLTEFSEQMKKFIDYLTENVYDYECVSELITNLGRCTNEVTKGQLELLREYWNNERFPQFKTYIKEHNITKASGKKAVSDHLWKLKQLKDELELMYLPQRKYDEVNTLYYRATGRTLEEDMPSPQTRALAVNKETYESLTTMLKEFILANAFCEGTSTEIEDRQELVTQWNDADNNIDIEETRRENGTAPLNPHRWNKANEQRLVRNQQYGARKQHQEEPDTQDTQFVEYMEEDLPFDRVFELWLESQQ